MCRIVTVYKYVSDVQAMTYTRGRGPWSPISNHLEGRVQKTNNREVLI